MVKKAKLDILEIALDEPDGMTRQDEETAEEGGDDVSVVGIYGAGHSSKVRGWWRKPLFWLISISVALLGLAAGIMIVYYQGMDGKVSSVQKEKIISVAPFQETKRGVLLDGMVVDQKDEHGNIRIIFFDVALDIEGHRTTSSVDSNRVDVRSLIYAVLKKEAAEEGLSPEGRGRLKEKLKNELNGLLGENLVKGVYFTRYEMD